MVCVQVKCAAEASHGKYDDAPTMMALYLGFVGLPKKLGPLDQMRVYTCNMVGTGTRARRENTEKSPPGDESHHGFASLRYEGYRRLA